MYRYVFMLLLLAVVLLNACHRRQLIFLLAYVWVWCVYASPCSPSPDQLGVWWYVYAAFGEMAIIAIALKLRTGPSVTVASLSMIAVVVNIAAAIEFKTSAHFIYDNYSNAIQFTEAAQAACFGLFSPPLVRGARQLVAFYEQERRIRPWMNRHSKLPVPPLSN